MSLRHKTLLVVIVTVLGLVALLYGVTRMIVIGQFKQLEQMDMEADIERAREAFSRSLDELNLLARDYAVWDDTYAFMTSRAPEYLNSNMTPNTFVQNDLHALLLVDREGGLVFGGQLDAAGQSIVDVSADLRNLPRSHPALFVHRDAQGSRGVLMTTTGALLVAAQPILTSDRDGPVRGTLLMARRFDQEELSRVARTARLSLAFWPADAASPQPPPLAHLGVRLDHERNRFIHRASEDTIEGYVLLNDFQNHPAIVLRVRSPRDIFMRGRVSLGYFLGALILAGIGFGVVTMLLLERLVLHRVARLSRRVRRLGAHGRIEGRVEIPGNDEIAALAQSVNELLNTIDRSESDLRNIAGHARCLLWSASATIAGDDTLEFEPVFHDTRATLRMVPVQIGRDESFIDAWRRACHSEDHAAACRYAREALRRGATVYTSSYRVQLADGTQRWISDDVSVQKESENRWRLVGVGTDITERVHAEQELQRARDSALEVARLKSEFLANMSHEIRTPLHGILGLTDLLTDSELSAAQQEYLDLVRLSAQSLMRVIEDLLDFSRLESGRLPLREASFNLRNVVHEAVRLSEPQAQAQQLALHASVDDAVPSACIGDAYRVRQVLLNLIGNAIKFTPSGRVDVEAVASSPDDGGVCEVRLVVRDTGIGIPRDQQQAIFQAFTQVDSSATRRYGGTGLGLAICKNLISMMGGRIRVKSAPGQGSTFDVALPLRVADEATRRSVGNRETTAFESIFNRSVALENAGGDEALLCELIDIFLRDAPPRMERIHNQCGGADVAALTGETNTLRSSLTMLAASASLVSLGDLERAASTGDATLTEEAFTRLVADIDRLSAALRNTLDEVTS